MDSRRLKYALLLCCNYDLLVGNSGQGKGMLPTAVKLFSAYFEPAMRAIETHGVKDEQRMVNKALSEWRDVLLDYSRKPHAERDGIVVSYPDQLSTMNYLLHRFLRLLQVMPERAFDDLYAQADARAVA